MTRFIFLAKFSVLPAPNQLSVYELKSDTDPDEPPPGISAEGIASLAKLFRLENGLMWIAWIDSPSQVEAEAYAAHYFAGAEVYPSSRRR